MGFSLASSAMVTNARIVSTGTEVPEDKTPAESAGVKLRDTNKFVRDEMSRHNNINQRFAIA